MVDFLPLFSRESTFVTSSLLFSTPSPFWKSVYAKREEFTPKESKFFLFWVDHFQKRQKLFDIVISPESVSFPLNPCPAE